MIYRYEAINQKGKRKKGTIEGNNVNDVIKLLKNKGLYAIDIQEEKESILKKEIEFGKQVKLEELVIFTRQMASLIKAGIPIIDTIYILSEQSENKKLRKILKEVEAGLKSGELFSATLAYHPKVFPTILINMVRAGEIAGSLDDTLESAATYLEKENITRKKVKSALTYPIVVSLFAIFVTIFLMIKVVPTFVEMYREYGSELPIPTKIVIGISDFLVDKWYLLFLVSLLAIVIFHYLYKNPKTKYYVDYYLLKLPIFGKLLQKAAIARFARTFSSLLASAIPILQALTMVSQIVHNEAIAKPIREAKEHLRQGNPLHEPLKNHKVFPPLLVHMIAIGEETGSLEELLNKVADFYESDVDGMTDQLKALIEPLMIILLTFIVGTIIMAVIMPMFGIYDLVG